MRQEYTHVLLYRSGGCRFQITKWIKPCSKFKTNTHVLATWCILTARKVARQLLQVQYYFPSVIISCIYSKFRPHYFSPPQIHSLVEVTWPNLPIFNCLKRITGNVCILILHHKFKERALRYSNSLDNSFGLYKQDQVQQKRVSWYNFLCMIMHMYI